MWQAEIRMLEKVGEVRTQATNHGAGLEQQTVATGRTDSLELPV